MTKLTKAEILALQPSNTVYHVKLTRLYWPKPVLEWEGDTELYIQRAPAYPRRNLPERLCTITPIAYNWAEGDYSCVNENGNIDVEDYMMEIFHLKPAPAQGIIQTSPLDLRAELASRRQELTQLEKALQTAEQHCQHNWTPSQYTPIEHKSYTIPGDAPGTMGIDWQGPTYVPARTENQWSRTCLNCGRTETTKTTVEQTVLGEVAGTVSKIQVPKF